jgi:hypothetical protein
MSKSPTTHTLGFACRVPTKGNGASTRNGDYPGGSTGGPGEGHKSVCGENVLFGSNGCPQIFLFVLGSATKAHADCIESDLGCVQTSLGTGPAKTLRHGTFKARPALFFSNMVAGASHTTTEDGPRVVGNQGRGA